MLTHEKYFDNNATTIASPQVVASMVEVLRDDFGNPSSIHSAGDRARDKIRDARTQVAELIGARPDQITFTSGGTEANNLVLTSAAQAFDRILTTAVEHSSVLTMIDPLRASGVEVDVLPVDSTGLVDLDRLEESLNKGARFASIQWANNETGVIQPISEIAQLCRRRGALLHCDAAQAVGKIPVDFDSLPIDFLTLTAHKFNGPQGVGAVVSKDPSFLHPMLFGGPQEEGLRPGTENVAGIVGLGTAARVRRETFLDANSRMQRLRDQFEQLIRDRLPDVHTNGGGANRIGNTSNLLFGNVDGQALVARLDQHGIRCSQSSACTNQRPEPSYVLRAMGLTEDEAYSSVRFSFGVYNTPEEVRSAAATIGDECEQLRRFSSQLANPYQGART